MDKERDKERDEELWISYSRTYEKRKLRCPRCGGILYEEYNWELPENLREYACIICGFRILVDESELRMESKLFFPTNN